MGHCCGCPVRLSSINVPWVRFRGSEAGLVGLAGEAGALCHGFYGGKVPLPRGAGRRPAPNAQNAGISGRDRPATRLLPDHAEEPTRNSIQRKPTHVPSLLLRPGLAAKRWTVTGSLTGGDAPALSLSWGPGPCSGTTLGLRPGTNGPVCVICRVHADTAGGPARSAHAADGERANRAALKTLNPQVAA